MMTMMLLCNIEAYISHRTNHIGFVVLLFYVGCSNIVNLIAINMGLLWFLTFSPRYLPYYNLSGTCMVVCLAKCGGYRQTSSSHCYCPPPIVPCRLTLVRWLWQVGPSLVIARDLIGRVTRSCFLIADLFCTRRISLQWRLFTYWPNMSGSI